MTADQVAAVAILEVARQLVLERPLNRSGSHFGEAEDGTNIESYFFDERIAQPQCRVCLHGGVGAAARKLGFMGDGRPSNAALTADFAVTKARGELRFTFSQATSLQDRVAVNQVFDAAIAALQGAPVAAAEGVKS